MKTLLGIEDPTPLLHSLLNLYDDLELFLSKREC